MKSLHCNACNSFHHLRINAEGELLSCQICSERLEQFDSPFCVDKPLVWSLYKVSFKPHRMLWRKGSFFVIACCNRHATQRAVAKLYGHLSVVQIGIQGTSPLYRLWYNEASTVFVTVRFPAGLRSTISGMDGHYFKLEQTLWQMKKHANLLPARPSNGFSMAIGLDSVGTS